MDETIEIGPANDEQCVRLRRALRSVPGFQLIFVEVEDGTVRSEVLRRLRGWVARGELGALAIVSYDGRAPIEQVLRGHPSGLVLTDLDAPHEVGHSFDDALRWLNWERDRLPSLLTGPLALVLGRDGLQRVLELAPDLVSWRRYTARFDDTHVRDLWTLHEAMPWHAVLAQERDRVPWPAWHRLLALPASVARPLVSAVTKAIRARGALGLFDEAEALYTQACLRRWADDEFAELHVAGAHVALDRGHGEIAAHRADTAEELIGSVPSPDARSRQAVLILDGRRSLLAGLDARGLAAYRQAAELALTRLDASGRVSGLVGAAIARRLGHDHRGATTELAAAAEVALAANVDWLEYHVALARAWVSDGREALAALSEAYRLATRAGSVEAVEVAVRAATIAASTRDVVNTASWHERGAAARTVHAPPWMQQASWRIDAWLATRRGDLAQASASYQKARAVDPTSAMAPVELAIGYAELAVGSVDAAGAAFERARADADVRHDLPAEARAEVGLGRVALARGADLDAAVTGLLHAIEIFEQGGERVGRSEAHRVLAEVLDRLGRADEAAAERQRAVDAAAAGGL
ncbi:MAG: hypothetical protein KBG48_28030 [Kofleriaceae bacterium]|nr:hypothetical protein [Kofleriaceae bacterium]MBP9171280.1 hypothetical protein [Kofleriaceae bacterium]MBP9861576.1 hypothetical protein [Kofleriaceae bacterium]